MSSSTSSSEERPRGPRLALRTLAVAAAITLLYHALLPWLPHEHPHGREQGRANALRNRARAEAYLARREAPEVTVVGTSIAARLAGLPPGWQVLAFDGGSPLTGLEIVLRAEDRPGVVVVETNRILGDVDRDLVDALFSPGRRRLLQWLPGLAAENRPSQIALAGARALRTALRGGASEVERVRVPGRRPELRDAMVERNLAAMEREVPASWLEPRVDRLVEAVRRLEQEGVRVVLVEIPEHPRSYEAPLKRQLRRRLARALPAERFEWAPLPDPDRFRTTDGVHLDPESAQRYAATLVRWLRNEGDDADAGLAQAAR